MFRISPTRVEIDLRALRHNYRQLKQRLPRGVRTLCVVKSNAYGHGAGPIARALEAEGANFFGVGTVDEGIQLRRSGIHRPILILLGLIEGHFAEILRYRLSPVLYDERTARRLHAFLKQKGRRVEVHLKVETGMSRLGILPGQVGPFCKHLKRFPTLEPVGLLTHLADSGEEDFTRRQFLRFEKAREVFEGFFPGSHLFHVANSQAAIDRKVSRGNGVWSARLGIALYGAYPLERDRRLLKLRSVMRLKSRVVSLKVFPSGTPVSYGRSFYTKRKSVIGVVPVGYADGYMRNLSNLSQVLVRGKRAPVVGKICMDMMMIDLTALPFVKVGDEVVLIGRQGKEEVTADELAAKAGTISYEIFCRIAERIQRVTR